MTRELHAAINLIARLLRSNGWDDPHAQAYRLLDAELAKLPADPQSEARGKYPAKDGTDTGDGYAKGKLMFAAAQPQSEAKDAARLDYLEKLRNIRVKQGYHWAAFNYEACDTSLTVRQQIDAAMAKENSND